MNFKTTNNAKFQYEIDLVLKNKRFNLSANIVAIGISKRPCDNMHLYALTLTKFDTNNRRLVNKLASNQTQFLDT